MEGAILTYPIALSFIAGLICFLAPKKAKNLPGTIALISSLACAVLAFQIFLKRPLEWQVGGTSLFLLDNLSSFTLLATCVFGFLIVLYSIGFMHQQNPLKQYYTYILWTIAASCGVLLSNNLILLLTFWGISGLLLYLLISLGGPQAAPAAKKTFIIVGGTDAVMILGAAIAWVISGTVQIDAINIPTTSAVAIAGFLCIFIAAIAKAGAMPLHTWITDSSEVAPLPVMAFLPASLDKLLGIYLLARLSFDMFKLMPNTLLSNIMIIVGAITIVAAVMMALIQRNFKRLLSYHAVSQVGYMVLGIGTAIPIGIAGGIFHMLNHAIYKCCLFLTGGNIEKRTYTTDLDKLGGLAKFMPITFITCVVASLSISGIPPFNGFMSKWMIYQGAISLFSENGPHFTAFLCLIAAMFGSALTLASFMKLIHATFLGDSSIELKARRTREVGPAMLIPVIVLAALCIVFGVFALSIPLKLFIIPAIKGGVAYTGLWNAPLATGLMLLGLLVGLAIYFVGNTIKACRKDTAYVGGEIIPSDNRVSGTEFYNTVKEISVLHKIYKWAKEKKFDIYEQGKNLVFYITEGLRALHKGILPAYVTWILAGFAVMLLLLAI